MSTYDEISTQNAFDWIDLQLGPLHVPYPDGNLRSPEVRRRQDGQVQVRGYTLRVGGTIGNFEVLAQLPASCWPSKVDSALVLGYNAQGAFRVDIGIDGTISTSLIQAGLIGVNFVNLTFDPL